MNFINKCLVVLISLSFFSCSLMFNGGSQAIRITGKEGTKVAITTPSGSYEDKLPATVVAKSSYSGITAKVIDDRYNTTTAIVDKSITLSFWANILNGWGFIIDAVTGSFWNYDDVTNVIVVEKK